MCTTCPVNRSCVHLQVTGLWLLSGVLCIMPLSEAVAAGGILQLGRIDASSACSTHSDRAVFVGDFKDASYVLSESGEAGDRHIGVSRRELRKLPS